MSESNQNAGKPGADVFASVPTKGDETKLVRIGVAWQSRNTPGVWNIVIEALPLRGAEDLERLQLVPRTDRSESGRSDNRRDDSRGRR